MVRFAAGVAAALDTQEPPRAPGALTEGTVCPEEMEKMSGGLDIH
jgi:hypothetical protein